MSDESVDRRTFAKSLAAGVTVAPLAAIAGSAGLTPRAEGAERKQDPKQEPQPAAKEVSSIDLMLDLLKRQYPAGLKPEHDEPLRRELERQVARGQILSDFPLTNADEPAPVFSAWRADDVERPPAK